MTESGAQSEHQEVSPVVDATVMARNFLQISQLQPGAGTAAPQPMIQGVQELLVQEASSSVVTHTEEYAQAIQEEYHITKILVKAGIRQQEYDEELKGEYFSNDSFLSGYLAIKKQDPNYYHEFYRQVMKALDGYCFQEQSLCLFVANELFFGKGFVLPSRYPSLLPFLPDRVLSCVNFLLEENNVVNGTKTIEDAINQRIVTSDIEK